jgi:hypothetical protein
MTNEGNISAHENDPLVDANVYKQHFRSDEEAFRLLYEISFLFLIKSLSVFNLT